MSEYSDEWLIARAEASKALLGQLPTAFRGNFVLASAKLPAMNTEPRTQSADESIQRARTVPLED